MTPYPGTPPNSIFAGLALSRPGDFFGGGHTFGTRDWGTATCLDVARSQGGQAIDDFLYSPLTWTTPADGVTTLGSLDPVDVAPWVLISVDMTYGQWPNNGEYYNQCVGPIAPQVVRFESYFPDNVVPEWVVDPTAGSPTDFWGGQIECRAYLARPAGDPNGYPFEPGNPYTPLLWRLSELTSIELMWELKTGPYIELANGRGYVDLTAIPMQYRDGWGPPVTRLMTLV